MKRDKGAAKFGDAWEYSWWCSGTRHMTKLNQAVRAAIKTQTRRLGRANRSHLVAPRLYWVPAIANLEAPTLAELQTGVRL